MKKSKHTDAQIIFILKQAEEGVPELCREHGMSSASFYGSIRTRHTTDAIIGYFYSLTKD